MTTNKAETVKKILHFCALPEEGIDMTKVLDLIKGSTPYSPEPTPYDSRLETMYRDLLSLCA